jgi:hypothetical protein
MSGVLLDNPQPDYYKRDESGAILLGRDGRPEFLPPFHDRPPEMHGFARTLGTWVNPDADNERFLYEAPEHIRESLQRAKMLAGPFEPRAAAGWQVSISRLDGDGTAITGVTTEQLLVPDYTVPGGFIYGGKQLKYVLWGRQSSVITTPGTFTIRLRWGGIAGTAIITSKAQRLRTASAASNAASQIEMLVTFRRGGPAGVAIGMGMCALSGASGTAGEATADAVWPDAPAEVTALDTSTAKAFSPTGQFSLTTGAWTTHMARVEDLT